MTDPPLFPARPPKPEPDRQRIGKYLVARLHPRPTSHARITDIWTIEGNDGTALGHVAWYGPWRQYVYEPVDGTVYNNTCLVDIAAFLAKVNAAQRGKA